MNVGLPVLRLQDAWRECERHVHHMFHAMSAVRPLWPLTVERYAALTDEEVRDVDQFILRFTKLQDTIGNRFLPAILQYLEEPYDGRPMLDKLNRLEKLGFIQSVENWQRIRDIRNKFAHDYTDDIEKNAEHLNLAFESALDLFDLLTEATAKLMREQVGLELGRPLKENRPDWVRRQ